MQPLLSIVIANLNYGHFLDQALTSVNLQSCQDFELIICDGSSTDNSVEIIKKYTNGLPPNTMKTEHSATRSPIAWWCSEKDAGQSDAFNKGFRHARGKYLTWLNADDLMLPGTISAFKRLVVRRSPDWVSGNFIRFENKSGLICEANWGPHVFPQFLQGVDGPLMVFGPTTFWSRRAFETVGELDVSFHYMMDTEYWKRLVYHGYRQVRLNHDCWAFRMHKESKTAEYGNHRLAEKTRRAFDREKKVFVDRYPAKVNALKKVFLIITRIVDGSFAYRAYRSLCLRGKAMRDVYGNLDT